MSYNKGKIKTESTAKGWLDPYKKDVIYDPRGQWAHPGEVTRIPSNDITMRNVPYPVYGVDNLGNGQMMLPEQDYKFPGDSVTEYPMLQYGGSGRTKLSREAIKDYLERDEIKGRPMTSRQRDFFMTEGGFEENEYGDIIDPNSGELYLEPGEASEFRYGGGLHKGRKRYSKRTTHKNIQDSVNFLFAQNALLFGPRRRHLYLPKAQDGGQWLDNYAEGGSKLAQRAENMAAIAAKRAGNKPKKSSSDTSFTRSSSLGYRYQEGGEQNNWLEQYK